MSKYPGRVVTDLAPAGYSVAFDGSGDTLNLGAQTAFSFGTGDFTIECWINLSAISANYQCIFDFRPTATNGLYPAIFLFNSTSTPYLYYFVNNSTVITGTTYLKANTWYHIALCRSGTSTRMFLNGVQEGSTYTDSNNYIVGSSRPIFGGNGFAADSYLNGYMSNIRVVKGTALYTAAFTPPTQLFNITNTSLLTCNSPAIIDQSNNAFAITTNGNAAVSTFTPFRAYVPYNPALGASTPGIWTLDEAMQAKATRRWNMYDPSFNLTTLLLHGNGTNGAQNNTFLDSSSNGFSITRNGNTTQGSFSPFSQTGWGNFFNGTNSNISAPSNAVFDFGTGDFTIESWVYLTGYSANYTGVYAAAIVSRDQNASSANRNYWLNISGTASSWTQIVFSFFSGTTLSSKTENYTFNLNTWYNITVVRSSGTVNIYINGTAVGSGVSMPSAPNTAAIPLYVGQQGYSTLEYYFPGYISNVRITKGGALYTSNFTPSTTPLTTTVSAGTVSLLTCQSNRFVDNSASPLTITVNGTPSVQAFSPFVPSGAYTTTAVGGSGYFDGTGDKLTAAADAAFQFGTGNFAVEFWFYPTSLSGYQTPIDMGYNSAGSYNIQTGIGDGRPVFYSNSVALITSSTAWTLNAFNHVVVCRSGTTLSMFINGARTATATNSTNFNSNSTLGVGAAATASPDYPVVGYLSGVRLVKGSSVYDPTLTTLTVPTAPLTAITNTSLLCNFTNAGIVDSTAKNVLETVGNAQISTTQSKFGGSSMSFDGTTDYVVEPTNVNFGYGTGDFTIEFWLRLNSTALQTVVSNLTSATSLNPHIYIASGGSIRYFTSNADRITGSTLSTNQWYHIAVCRSGTSTRLFIDGTQSGSTYTDSNNYGTTAPLGIGTYWASGTPNTADTLNGYIDDLRITKFARYTGNFTPQTSQWQDE